MDSLPVILLPTTHGGQLLTSRRVANQLPVWRIKLLGVRFDTSFFYHSMNLGGLTGFVCQGKAYFFVRQKRTNRLAIRCAQLGRSLPTCLWPTCKLQIYRIRRTQAEPIGQQWTFRPNVFWGWESLGLFWNHFQRRGIEFVHGSTLVASILNAPYRINP